MSIKTEIELKIKMVEWFDDHFYKITFADGITEYIPSVTTKLGAIAKPFLVQWYGDLGTREANLRKLEAADRGSRIHYAWYVFATKGAVIYQPYKKPIYTQQEIHQLEEKFEGNISILYSQDEMYEMTKLQKFFNILQPKILLSESIVYDLDEKDAGQMDNLFKIKGGEYELNGMVPLKLPEGIYVFDLKTGNYIGKEAKMQTACYAKCVNKMGMGPVKGVLIGHTSAKTKKGIEGFATIYLDENDIEQEYLDYRHVATIWQREFGNSKPRVFEIPTLIMNKGE